MKVTVDHELCSGDGICVELCPEVFEMNDDDKAIVLVDKVPSEHEAAVREASETCPEACIYIEE